jgi:hypothetical protein
LAAFPARIALRGILHRIRVPILITHGELNRQVPVESAHLAYNDCVNSPRRDLKIFAEQEGGEQHCSVVADWIPDVLITRKQELRVSESRLGFLRPSSAPQRPLCAAGSTDRRNTFCELLSWGLIEQGLSRPFVELPCDRAELGLAMQGQIGATRKILAQQSVGVFV